MKCPECKSDLIKGCCVRCGYMANGNKIKLISESVDKFKEQKLFNKNFDTMYRNEKIYINFLLGPLYFLYRGHFILGTVFVLLDFLLFCYVGSIISMFIGQYIFLLITMCFYIFFNRIIYMGFANTVCLLIDNIRIKIIKMRYKDNYLEKLESYKHHKIYLLLTIMFYIIIIIVFALIKRYQNGLL